MEDLIDKAQRLHTQPNSQLEKELQQLKIIRDQTFEDLHDFVKQRERNPWRNWDKWRVVNKQRLQYFELTSVTKIKHAIEEEFMMVGEISRRLSMLE